MLPEKVANLKTAWSIVQTELIDLDPANDAEWDLMKTLVGINSSFRKTPWDKLTQLPLPEPKRKDSKQPELPLEPETECPTCHGRCTVTVGDGTEGICATCKGVGKVKASSEKKIASSTGTLTEAEAHTDVIQQAKVAADAYNLSSKEPIITMHCTKETLDKIIAINSILSLTESPPRLLGLMELDGKMYACTGFASEDTGATGALCHQVVEADKFEGDTRSDFSAVPNGTGFKASYKGKDYVLIGSEIKFLPEEKPAETLPPPRRHGRKSKAQKEAEQKAILDHPSVT